MNGEKWRGTNGKIYRVTLGSEPSTFSALRVVLGWASAFVHASKPAGSTPCPARRMDSAVKMRIAVFDLFIGVEPLAHAGCLRGRETGKRNITAVGDWA